MRPPAWLGRLLLFVSLILATSPQAIDYENEKPEADKDLNKEDSSLKEKQTVKNGVSQEETAPDPERSEKELSTNQNSTLTSKCAVDHGVTEGDIFNMSLLAKHTDDHGINEGELTQGAEGGKEEQLSNSPSCSKEDLKS